MAIRLYLCTAFHGGSGICSLPVLEESEMDMKHAKSSRLHSGRKKRRKGDTDRLRAQLAPLEELDKPAAEQQIGSPLSAATGEGDRQFGAIVVDNDDLKVPTDIVETGGKGQFWGIEPVVLVVLIIMLGFIGFIAWQIALMPPR